VWKVDYVNERVLLDQEMCAGITSRSSRSRAAVSTLSQAAHLRSARSTIRRELLALLFALVVIAHAERTRQMKEALDVHQGKEGGGRWLRRPKVEWFFNLEGVFESELRDPRPRAGKGAWGALN
jgi:hypothetical protein